jgi:hypothetical protein
MAIGEAIILSCKYKQYVGESNFIIRAYGQMAAPGVITRQQARQAVTNGLGHATGQMEIMS